jgi:uncharacterized protein HemX
VSLQDVEVKERLLKKLVLLLGLVLSLSSALPGYAKARKVKLNPEARAAQKRNKGLQKEAKRKAKARRNEIKRLRARR